MPPRALIGRRALLVAIAVAAIAAVLGGLARIGWDVPLGRGRVIEHGPLLVLGVFAALIALERAVALSSTWAYAAPVALAAGAALQLAELARAGALAATAGTVALVAVNAAIVRRQAAPYTAIMLLGSLVLAIAAWAWTRDAPVFALAPAWIAFFALTITSERLELSRLVPTPRAATVALVVIAVVLAAAALVAIDRPAPAVRVAGAALIAIGAWELRFDAARRTGRRPGLPRYAAVAVLAGAAWLAVAGALLAVRGLPPAGPDYDAPLHAVFVGYVVSMVFAHAPIILPAVARVTLRFHRALYAPLALLHVSVTARVAGDLEGSFELRRAGGLGNALALALFAIVAITARGRRSPDAFLTHDRPARASKTA